MDSVTTWYCTRISGIPFEAGERNPIMRRLGLKKSVLFAALLEKFRAPYHNLRVIRYFIRQPRERTRI